VRAHNFSASISILPAKSVTSIFQSKIRSAMTKKEARAGALGRGCRTRGKLVSRLALVSMALLLTACTAARKEAKHQGGFERLAAERIGIDFVNRLTETEARNVLAYEYFYNGGGVAVGDFDNDGLPDLYFTGNMTPNRMYRNLGDLRFEDVTERAGVAGRSDAWATGVTLVDINADGWLDIYVCYSGDLAPELRRNQLFVNNQDGTFAERAAEYGLDSPAYSTHALFFDYDGDGDLDCYLLNHNIVEFKNFDAAFVKNMIDEYAGDKLLRNDDGVFVDVSAKAGIKQNPLGFGLGVAACDLDGDGRLDLYISNDYTEEDYLYINQGDGTFREELRRRMGHIPQFSMGSDIADFNNDGWSDIIALDMLPEDNRRQKLLYGPDEYEKFQSMLRNDFYHQIMRNMLQLNNGDGTFSEIGQLAGVSNTDWSWAALFADVDNDGWQDLFITNGYLRDYTNRDFMAYYANERIREVRGEPSAALVEIISQMPSTKTHNYLFRNRGDLTFANMVEAWGFADPLLSNGAVFADLDGDGDLDLVLNNVNEPAAVYENRVAAGNFLLARLHGEGNNTGGIGAKVEVFYDTEGYAMRRFMPSRGFQSAMHVPLHFGLGGAQQVEQLVVTWPDGRQQTLREIAAGQTIDLFQRDATAPEALSLSPAPLFEPWSDPLAFAHRQPPSVDFKRQTLLPWMLTGQGPAMALGDVNGDGRPDLFIGGAKLQSGALFIQNPDGSFNLSEQEDFRRDAIHEDVDALFFDANGNGHLDLYVVSGGYDYLPRDLALQDRLYFNDGRGNFTRRKEALPIMLSSGGCVAAADIDGDGALDLFVGGRCIPGEFPSIPESFLLRNDGQGKFSPATEELAPELKNIGMVAVAQWLDTDGDGREDLVLAGDYMPITFFRNTGGRLEKMSNPIRRPDSDAPAAIQGWWSAMAVADLNGDGRPDIVLGNLGANHQMNVSQATPAILYAADFDQNETVDPVLSYVIQGARYPAFSRDELLAQLPSLRKQFNDYASYAAATIEEVFSPEQLEHADKFQADQCHSVWLENRGAGRWLMRELPLIAQTSPIFAIAVLDFDHDERPDLLLAGNLERTRANRGRWDANYGLLLRNRGDGNFDLIPQHRSGLQVWGETRAIAILPHRGQQRLLFVRNNAEPAGYILARPSL
jgi:hypothetical protein